MPLFARFLILVTLIAGMAAGTLATAGWTVVTVLQEVTSAYAGIIGIIQLLDRTKLGYEFLLLDAADHKIDLGDDFERTTLRLQLEEVVRQQNDLATSPGLLDTIGPTTAANLIGRAAATGESLRVWLDALAAGSADSVDTRAAFARASADFEAFHLLTERVEQRMLGDAAITVLHAREMRDRLRTLLIACFAVLMLSGVLAALLFRRWMVVPVTELRAATAELARGNFAYRIRIAGRDELAKLGTEVNTMATTVIATQQRLVERERLAAVGEMMRRLVHNLRNPLAGIRSLAEITRSELPRDSELRENQDRIVIAVDRFESWLTDVLRSTSPMQVHPRPVPLKPLIARAVETAAPNARGSEIDLRIDPEGLPESIDADPVHLEQALVSLLSNALEVTPRRGQIMISGVVPVEPPARVSDLVAATGRSDWWVLRVDDSGPGVPEELRERVFAPYFTTKKSGSGIGLAMVQNIARSHGGRAWVETSPAGGARFVLAAPLNAASATGHLNPPRLHDAKNGEPTE